MYGISIMPIEIIATADNIIGYGKIMAADNISDIFHKPAKIEKNPSMRMLLSISLLRRLKITKAMIKNPKRIAKMPNISIGKSFFTKVLQMV